MIKKIIRPLHLIIGLTSGIVLFIVAITGCFTAFEEEIRNAMYADYMEVKVSSTKRKTIDEIAFIAKKEYTKEEIKNIRVRPEKTSSIEVVFQDRQSVYVNPYTGKVLGSVNKEDDFFGTILEIHRNLYLDETGEMITGISALCTLIMLISGIVLWWPKKGMVKQKFTIMRKVNWRKTNYDLHNVLGFYASWIIIFTVLSGLIWSFEWAQDGLYWFTDSKKEPRMEVESRIQKFSMIGPDFVYHKAISKFPKHKECIINLPEGDKGSYRISFRYNDKGFYRQIDNLFYDQYSGKLIDKKMFSQLSTGDKIRMTNINIHTGKILGLFGQLLVFFASLIVASLPITGFLIWKNKRN